MLILGVFSSSLKENLNKVTVNSLAKTKRKHSMVSGDKSEFLNNFETGGWISG